MGKEILLGYEYNNKIISKNELFDILYKRATPMKVGKSDIGIWCEKCANIVKEEDLFCPNCGQALDWRVQE